MADGSVPKPQASERAHSGGGARTLVFRVAAVTLSIAVVLLVAEFALRQFAPQASRFTGAGLYMPHDDIGHVLRPNLRAADNPARIATNSHGFRDREYALGKPDGTLRIVGIGDSFTFGAGPVEDNFLDLLEDRLAGDLAIPVEVLNLGVPAYNTRQETLHLKEFGLQFSPDLVVLAFFVGNDIEENESDTIFRVVDGELSDRQRRPGPFTRLLWKSHLYRRLRPLLLGTVHAADSGLKNFLEIERRRLKICRVPLAQRYETGFRRSEQRILALRNDLAELEIDLLVMLIPDEYQVRRSLFSEVIEHFDMDASRFDLEQPQRRLGAFLENNDIPFVDLLAPLREAEAAAPTYLPRNTHLNRRGNQVAANALAAWIVEHAGQLSNPGR